MKIARNEDWPVLRPQWAVRVDQIMIVCPDRGDAARGGLEPIFPKFCFAANVRFGARPPPRKVLV